jgi:hypothetical protein
VFQRRLGRDEGAADIDVDHLVQFFQRGLLEFVRDRRAGGGATGLPACARGYLSGAVTSRPLAGDQPTVDLMIGYHRANRSPILEKFLSGIDALSARIYGKARAG